MTQAMSWPQYLRETTMPIVHPLTAISLHLEIFFNAQQLGSGTGFIVARDGEHFLITNWHVVSGRDPKTDNPLSGLAAIPNTIRIWHHRKDLLGKWIPKDVSLQDGNGKLTWKEIDTADGKADVIALPIEVTNDIDVHPLDITLANTDLIILPSDPVSIIGFPYNQSAFGKFPIWKTGHVASDIDIDYAKRPIFLIDASTKKGMSGSPVIAYRSGLIHSSEGFQLGVPPRTKFMGIYSGRVQDEELSELSNLGQVWKPSVIVQLLGI